MASWWWSELFQSFIATAQDIWVKYMEGKLGSPITIEYFFFLIFSIFFNSYNWILMPPIINKPKPNLTYILSR